MADYRNLQDTDMQSAMDDYSDAEPQNAQVEIVAQLKQIVLGAYNKDSSAILDIAADLGISRERLADHYIPEVARELGKQWCEDELGFADVTIGTARLQSMLRDLGPEWSADDSANPDAATVLLVVPEQTFHTLGAMVIAGQLRRNGLSVRVHLGASPKSIFELCEFTKYDAVFISATVDENIAHLKQIVDAVKKANKKPTPIVIGGALTIADDNVIARTGADYVTNSADTAITLCNLSQNIRPNAMMEN